MVDTNLGTTSAPETGIPPVDTKAEAPAEAETKPGDSIEFGFDPKKEEVTAEKVTAEAPDLTVPNTEPNPIASGVDDAVKSEPVLPVAEPAAPTNPENSDLINSPADKMEEIRSTIAGMPDTPPTADPTAPETTAPVAPPVEAAVGAQPETTGASASTDPEDHWSVGQAPPENPAASPFVEQTASLGSDKKTGDDKNVVENKPEVKRSWFQKLFGIGNNTKETGQNPEDTK